MDTDTSSVSQNKESPQIVEDARAEDPKEVRPVHGVKWFLVCAACYIFAFLYGLDTTIAADVQAAVIAEFNNVEQLTWVGSGFPLGSICVLLPLSNIYNHFNLKWIYIGGGIVFEVGSALCGAAPSMNALIVGRVLAGTGGSSIFLGNLHYFSRLTTPTERGLYIGLIGFCWGIGAVLGPVVGGSFAESGATWRWAFYINLVIGALVCPIYLLYLPSVRADRRHALEVLKEVDFCGWFLTALSWVLFSVCFTLAGSRWAWGSGPNIALLVVWIVVFLATIIQQYFAIFTTKERRLFPGHLVVSRTQSLLFVVMAASASSLFLTIYYIPVYFQFVKNDSAIMAAVRLLPYVILAVTVNLASGHLLSSVKYYMPLYLIGGILITAGGALLVTLLKYSTSTASIYGFTVILAIGTGLTINTTYSVASLTRPADIGNALSFQNISQLGATVICSVVAGQIFQSYSISNLSRVLAGQGFTHAELVSAVAGAQSELFQQLDGGLKIAAIGAIVDAIQRLFVLVVVAGVVMVIASAFMKVEKLQFKGELQAGG